ncbi:serine hydrolase domain-containing protein [Jiangella asiatica]|uniref:Class A beta-lactamase-related serine hydrolase n=1 Tax=Jiangella asiatica TaxID=2530372 RepID=A0A4R5D401_9ACTN|nr:serine hydrolase domain-containing protein [Jiangella asiatica]TDE08119.1 class A beta-lactamase-related serine hydrolase [Jiangella asiatica]
MNAHHDTTAPALSRRSVLGMLGAVPVANGSGIALAGAARADETAGKSATTAAGGRIPEELRPGGKFDQYLADLAEKDAFAGTVLVRLKGRDVLSRSYGMANKEKEIPHGPDTIFTLGSVPKAMTAVAITQLAAAGKVDFHEKLGAYVDGFSDEVANTVTVHQMLTHTSGLTDYHRIEGFWKEAPTWDTVEATWNGCLEYVQLDELKFPAGYSNSAFFALGAIVAAVCDEDSYYDYIRRHVFEVAGMTSSDWFTLPEAREDPRIAHPYFKNEAGEWLDAVLEDDQLFVGTPAGGAFATAGDLARFAEAVMDDTLLGEAGWTHLATSPKTPMPQPGGTPFEAYGTVWRLMNGQRTVSKTGGSKGVSASVEWFPDSGWVAVALANYARAAETVGERLRELITAA